MVSPRAGGFLSQTATREPAHPRSAEQGLQYPAATRAAGLLCELVVYLFLVTSTPNHLAILELLASLLVARVTAKLSMSGGSGFSSLSIGNGTSMRRHANSVPPMTTRSTAARTETWRCSSMPHLSHGFGMQPGTSGNTCWAPRSRSRPHL